MYSRNTFKSLRLVKPSSGYGRFKGGKNGILSFVVFESATTEQEYAKVTVLFFICICFVYQQQLQAITNT